MFQREHAPTDLSSYGKKKVTDAFIGLGRCFMIPRMPLNIDGGIKSIKQNPNISVLN